MMGNQRTMTLGDMSPKMASQSLKLMMGSSRQWEGGGQLEIFERLKRPVQFGGPNSSSRVSVVLFAIKFRMLSIFRDL